MYLIQRKALRTKRPRITGSLPAIHSTDGNCGSPPFADWIGLPHLLHRRGFPRLDSSLWLGKLCQSDRHHCVVVSLLLALVSALSAKAFWPKVRQNLHHSLRGGHFVSRSRAFRSCGTFAPILSNLLTKMPTDEPKLFLLGSSHPVASLEERELISLPTEQVDLFYQGLRSLPGMKECLLLNTCNRTEIYGAETAVRPFPRFVTT